MLLHGLTVTVYECAVDHIFNPLNYLRGYWHWIFILECI